ncbi:putative cytochrome P450 NDAI_0A04250 [Naumovozyma dairenensis CBS 421]|uniref:Cytochrome P450 n=1 Tax=Naumovozyma dairenensis (strain ATCC 10597 / BCRC 20456 / CBS 421 / NBRC 0211 / NRRL Y-12639) TaxID=1071378 RepID=G0W444_NAUDC|nr:hypothetical protein NDAI_0A04250 [Naumovozyma dairenensis CBS 421]CCD22582.1 hypothetical protein NDAI_0A04250 [Naumovozyma dairenensis CBS 421]
MFVFHFLSSNEALKVSKQLCADPQENKMTLIKLFLIIFLSLLGLLIFKVVVPPLDFPQNIPTIPFYVIFLPSIFDIDQTQLYNIYIRKSMEKYGAVKIFFGSRWNILVSRPEYLAQMFKDENTFAKSGNQKKIPYSVIAAYTGDNVISAHGDVWRTYRGIMANGLQQFDSKPFYTNSKKFCKLVNDEVIKSDSNEVIMGPLIQRLALDNISQVVLGFDFGTLNGEANPLHRHLLRIKKQIFHPFFLTFPFFDKLGFPARKKGFKDVEKFRELLVTRVQDELVNNYKFEQTSFTSSDLIKAYNNKIIDYKQLTDNIVILLVAGHENPQLLLTTCLCLMAKYHDTWQTEIWEQTKNASTTKELNENPLLNSFIFEAVRLYPPLNTIINRKTIKACKLGPEIVIPKILMLGIIVLVCTHDKKNWGNTADVFDPLRWGTDIDTIMTNWKKSKTVCTMPSFHGGRRACLGEKLALQEIRISLVEFIRKFDFKLAPSWEEKLTPAGPLCPFNLKLKLEPRTISIHNFEKEAKVEVEVVSM